MNVFEYDYHRLKTASKGGLRLLTALVLFSYCSEISTSQTATLPAVLPAPDRIQIVQQAPTPDRCATLNLPADKDKEETLRIARALGICDSLHRMFDQGESTSARFSLLEQQPGEEIPLGAAEVEKMLQKPDGQAELLREFAAELEKERDERKQLVEELQSRTETQRVSSALAGLASDSDRVRAQVQEVIASRMASEQDIEFERYRRTKFLNAFLGTTVSTVGTGLQLSSNLNVQRSGDYLGIAGGGITALFNICTADWNVPDVNSDPPSSSILFRAFDSDNQSELLPPTVWSVLDDADKIAMKGIFTPNRGTTEFPLAHLSCHWGAPPVNKKVAKSISTLRT
jgi:hypothetical protein